METKKKRLSDALKVIEEILAIDPEADQSLLYRIAHVAREPSCKEVHGDWEEEFQNLKDDLLKKEDSTEPETDLLRNLN